MNSDEQVTLEIRAGNESAFTAQASGYHLAFLIGAALVVAAIVVAIKVVQPEEQVAAEAGVANEAGTPDADPAYSEAG